MDTAVRCSLAEHCNNGALLQICQSARGEPLDGGVCPYGRVNRTLRCIDRHRIALDLFNGANQRGPAAKALATSTPAGLVLRLRAGLVWVLLIRLPGPRPLLGLGCLSLAELSGRLLQA